MKKIALYQCRFRSVYPKHEKKLVLPHWVRLSIKKPCFFFVMWRLAIKNMKKFMLFSFRANESWFICPFGNTWFFSCINKRANESWFICPFGNTRKKSWFSIFSRVFVLKIFFYFHTWKWHFHMWKCYWKCYFQMWNYHFHV